MDAAAVHQAQVAEKCPRVHRFTSQLGSYLPYECLFNTPAFQQSIQVPRQVTPRLPIQCRTDTPHVMDTLETLHHLDVRDFAKLRGGAAAQGRGDVRVNEERTLLNMKNVKEGKWNERSSTRLKHSVAGGMDKYTPSTE